MTEPDIPTTLRAALIKQLEQASSFAPEVIEEVLARVADVPYVGNYDTYLQAALAVATSVLEAAVAALKAESETRLAAQRAEIEEREIRNAESLRRFKEFRAMHTSGIVH